MSYKVSVVCCSYNRLSALKDTIDNKRSILGVDELLFILDGSTDGSLEFLTDQSGIDERIVVLSKEHQGVQAARNYGLSMAKGDYILFLDDDDLAPQDIVDILVSKLYKFEAVAAGGAWLNRTGSNNHQAPRFDDRTNRRPASTCGLATHQAVLYDEDFLTPFLNGNYLIDANVAHSIRYDVAYTANAWREETDLFLRMWQKGLRIVRTSDTGTWIVRRYVGGQRGSFIKYEFYVAVNEFRFWRRHGKLLHGFGERGGPMLNTLKLVSTRMKSLLVAKLGR